MVSVRSTQEEYVGRSKNSPITCAATRYMELAEFSVLFGPPTVQRPRGLCETSPQLGRFLIFGRGLYGDGEAIHHGHGGQQSRSQRWSFSIRRGIMAAAVTAVLATCVLFFAPTVFAQSASDSASY